MAKSPSKPAKKTAAKPAIAAKPKPPTAKKKPAKQASAEKAASESSKPKTAKTAPLMVKASTATKSVLKETSQKISQLASDILADRIVPTAEQIKAIAASALGQDETKGKKAKGKKK